MRQVEAPTRRVNCDDVIPAAERARLLPRRTVHHDRSCEGDACFADTCAYRLDGYDPGVRVIFDCREGLTPKDVRTAEYFSTRRKAARAVPGLGAAAVADGEGLTFFDADSACLVTIRDESTSPDEHLALARVIESNLTADD